MDNQLVIDCAKSLGFIPPFFVNESKLRVFPYPGEYYILDNTSLIGKRVKSVALFIVTDDDIKSYIRDNKINEIINK
jgi:hypothetical protein